MAVDHRAHNAIALAIQAGRLPPANTLACADCGTQARAYHHLSYERHRWLDVVALCVRCHLGRHRGRPNIPAHRDARVQIAVTIPRELADRLRAEARRDRRRIGSVIAKAIDAYLNRPHPKRP